MGNRKNFHRFPQKSLIFPTFSPLWIFPSPCGFSFPQTCRIFQATCLPPPPFPQTTIDWPGCGKVKILYNRGKFSVFNLSLPTRVWETRNFPIFGQGFSKENWGWIFPANTVFCGFYGFFQGVWDRNPVFHNFAPSTATAANLLFFYIFILSLSDKAERVGFPRTAGGQGGGRHKSKVSRPPFVSVPPRTLY